MLTFMERKIGIFLLNTQLLLRLLQLTHAVSKKMLESLIIMRFDKKAVNTLVFLHGLRNIK